MNARAALVAVSLLLLGMAWMLRGTSAVAPARPAPASAARSAPVPPPVAPTPPIRNVFQYLDRPSPTAAGAPPFAREAEPAPPPSAEPSAAPSPVRLVGILRRGGALEAALSVHGEVVVLAAGETFEGYAVLSIDEDEGVSLRAPDGTTLRLVPDSG